MIKLIKSTFFNEAETKQQLVDFIAKTDVLSMGTECQEFEQLFAKKQGRAYAVFVNSGSSANLVLIQALMNRGALKPGDKVGVSALTWPTNIMPLMQLGLEPVMIDCNIETLNVSPDELQKNLATIQAFFLTNVLGFTDNITRIQELCNDAGVCLIEDNCESLGSQINGKLTGNFSMAATFSFFVGHHMSTIEGGMICTDDEELYNMLLMVRAHGWDRNLPMKAQQQLRKQHDIDTFFARYTFYVLAFNVRPTEINGFLGKAQVQYWDKIVQARAQNFKLFHEMLKQNNDFLTLRVDHMDIVSNFAVPVICKDSATCEKYKKRFSDHDIEIRPIIAGNMTQQPFYRAFAKDAAICPVTTLIHQNGFYFGNNPDMTEEEIETIHQALTKS